MRCGLAFAFLLGALLFLCGVPSLHSQTDADWVWTDKQFGPVLDALMPLKKHGGVFVSYRANRDLVTSTPEYWFTIGREPKENGNGLQSYISAHVRVAQPSSIYDQLTTIHREQPAVQDTTSIQQRMKLQKFDLTEMNCPAIKERLEKLGNLSAKLPEINGNYVILHPMIHAFYISGADGDATLTLVDEKNPLVRWAQDTRRVLDACEKHVSWR